MIVGIGKAGNPDCMDGVTPNMVVGSNTEVRVVLLVLLSSLHLIHRNQH